MNTLTVAKPTSVLPVAAFIYKGQLMSLIEVRLYETKWRRKSSINSEEVGRGPRAPIQ